LATLPIRIPRRAKVFALKQASSLSSPTRLDTPLFYELHKLHQVVLYIASKDRVWGVRSVHSKINEGTNGTFL